MSDTIKPGDPADKAADGAFGGQPTTGSHRAGYGETLARVEAWLRAHPRATLASGEGWALVEEIDRLREQLYLANESATSAAAEHRWMSGEIQKFIRLWHGEEAKNARLRAAIERVRALHRPTFDGAYCVVCYASYSSDWALYPCPTIRALDREDA
jgi:hypothetical protein